MEQNGNAIRVVFSDLLLKNVRGRVVIICELAKTVEELGLKLSRGHKVRTSFLPHEGETFEDVQRNESFLVLILNIP